MFDKGQKQSSTLSCDSSYLLFMITHPTLYLDHFVMHLLQRSFEYNTDPRNHVEPNMVSPREGDEIT